MQTAQTEQAKPIMLPPFFNIHSNSITNYTWLYSWKVVAASQLMFLHGHTLLKAKEGSPVYYKYRNLRSINLLHVQR